MYWPADGSDGERILDTGYWILDGQLFKDIPGLPLVGSRDFCTRKSLYRVKIENTEPGIVHHFSLMNKQSFF
jgi:hypothetical protein